MESNQNLYEKYENIIISFDAAELANSGISTRLVILKSLDNNKPKRIKLINPLSSLYSIQGYIFQINFVQLFQRPFCIIDGVYSGDEVIAEYKKGEQIQNNITVTCQRISGTQGDSAGQFPLNTPVFTCGLVYQYW